MHRGLTEAQARESLLRDGYNELPSSRRRNIFAIAFDVAKEPMLLLLVACGVIYLILGDKHEAYMLLGSCFIVIGITFYQERKTERALEALRDLSSPRALVIRDGVRRRIAGRDVVRGDIVVIAEGDRVPADAALLEDVNLSVDESLLTGESVSVRKTVWDGKSLAARPGGDDLPFVYSGTLVVQGKAVCQVLETGMGTEIGKIGKSLQQIAPEENTTIQKETTRFVRIFFVIGALCCAAVTLIYGYTQHNFLNGILAGITLAMSMMPEEFPVVLTIFLALGAWRIAKKGVLTRRVPAVEMLGAATVLCADKTGTLTENRMSVERLVADDVSLPVDGTVQTIPERFHRLIEFSILASQKDPFDPMEKAFRALGERALAGTEHIHSDWTLVKEYPLSPHLLAMSEVWESADKSAYVIAAKGAPEAVIELCHMDAGAAAAVLRQVQEMAEDGLRVLAVAAAEGSRSALPSVQHDFPFHFLGLMGLADPIRSDVPPAIAECKTAGIRVIMITGDHPHTAAAIARQVGLATEGALITGKEMDAMDDATLRERLKTASVFARVVPEQKLRLVNALRANGEIVAMTGDGVNDAPALKAAHIGIAMGGRGTDVARESSDLVLLNDNFASIVSAVRMGRRIFDNLKKAMSYIIAIHVPIAGLSLVPVLLRWPLVLLPMHIVFLELIIDPACSIVFEVEPEERGIMHRPPRDSREPMFTRQRVLLSLLQGGIVLCIVLLVFAAALLMGKSPEESRALTFTTLIVANLCLILANRSWSRTIIGSFRNRNPAVWWVIGGALSFLFLILSVPFLRGIFRFVPLRPVEIAVCFAAGFFSILWFEAMKLVSRRKLL